MAKAFHVFRYHFNEIAEHDNNSEFKVYNIRYNDDEECVEYMITDLDKCNLSYIYKDSFKYNWRNLPIGSKVCYTNLESIEPILVERHGKDYWKDIFVLKLFDKYEKVRNEKTAKNKEDIRILRTQQLNKRAYNIKLLSEKLYDDEQFLEQQELWLAEKNTMLEQRQNKIKQYEKDISQKEKECLSQEAELATREAKCKIKKRIQDKNIT